MAHCWPNSTFGITSLSWSRYESPPNDFLSVYRYSIWYVFVINRDEVYCCGSGCEHCQQHESWSRLSRMPEVKQC